MRDYDSFWATDITLQAAPAAVRAAARAAMSVYRSGGGNMQDTEDAFYTAWTRSEQKICEVLWRDTPSIPIVSASGDDVFLDSDYSLDREAWFVDALDGEEEFNQGTGLFTINVGLIERRLPRLGVIHVPARNTLYVGEVRFGARRAKVSPDDWHAMRDESGVVLDAAKSIPNGETLTYNKSERNNPAFFVTAAAGA